MKYLKGAESRHGLISRTSLMTGLLEVVDILVRFWPLIVYYFEETWT